MAFDLQDETPDEILLEVADEEDLFAEPPLRFGVAGTLASVVLHVWLLLTLERTFVEIPYSLDPPVIEAELAVQPPEPEEDVEPPLEFHLADPDDRELPVRAVITATSTGVIQNDRPQLESPPEQLPPVLAEKLRTQSYDIPEGVEVNKQFVVRGTIGESMLHIDSALDRITHEIANHLQEDKVLVVWMLDASESLVGQRKAIATRLHRVYGELGALEKAGQIPRLEQGLLSGVLTYGTTTQFITPEPTQHFGEVRDAITNAATDPSGVENVFGAVRQMLQRWHSYRTTNGRRILLVVVTDESGDDFAAHEPAIALCRRYGAKAYVVGPTAVFGRRQGYVPYVAPEDDQTYQLPVDLGPETPMYDHVQLPFWYAGPQYEYISAGFPPYALARLVAETGGVYFVTNMTTMAGLAPVGIFSPEVLQRFQPDYRYGTPEDYLKDLQNHPLRMAVVNAARLSRENPPEGTPPLELRVTADNFRQVATDAQKSVAISDFMLNQILQAFPQGIEQRLDAEPSPRWRMTFCLAYGRLLAQKARCLEYNAACADVKGNLTPQDINTKANRWQFRPSREINHAPSARQYARLATELLERVQREAPGTPWAVLAARELRDPLGIKVEYRFDPPPPLPSANDDPLGRTQPQLLLAEERRRQQAAANQPKPPPPKLPKL